MHGLVVPGNLRSAVSRAHRYEPDLNPNSSPDTPHTPSSLVKRGLSAADVERLAPLLVDRVRLSVQGAERRRALPAGGPRK